MVFKEFGKLPAMLMLLLLKINISNKLRTRRTQLELIDGFKNLEVSFTIHQPGINITLTQLQLLHSKPQMRAERSSKNTSRRPLLLSKLKTLLKPREPLKSPRWTLPTLRTLSVRKLESHPEELP